MSHSHDHSLGHTHAPVARATGDTRRALLTVLVITVVYMVAEAVGGVLTNSLALLADAGHMFSDAAALGLSLFAAWIARRPPSPKRTYGYYRVEILAALGNGATLIAIAMLIAIEALGRLRSPPDVQGLPMLAIAAGGLVVNLVGLRILGRVRDENLNAHGAWLHVMGDALGSVGAIVAGLLVWKLGWRWSDPLASVLIALLVIWSSWALVRQSVNILMEGAPSGIDVDAVRNSIAALPGVREVHDLHVWSITTGLEALSAHVVMDESRSQSELLAELSEKLEHEFGIGHITVQAEFAACDQTAHAH